MRRILRLPLSTHGARVIEREKGVATPFSQFPPFYYGPSPSILMPLLTLNTILRQPFFRFPCGSGGLFCGGPLLLPAPENEDGNGQKEEGEAADITCGGGTHEGIAAVGSQVQSQPGDGIAAAVSDGGGPDALRPPCQIG